MQVARAQFGKTTLFVVILGALALPAVVNVGTAYAHNPVLQSSLPETTSSAPQVESVEPKSIASPSVISKEKRKPTTFETRRNIVVAFLGEHFPELQVSLLKSEQKSPAKFVNAVSRLEVDVVRLRNIELKKPAKFELMLDLWKLKTQAEMTIAKYAKQESDRQLEERLRPLLDQMLDIRKTVVELERQSAVDKISKIDKRLLHLEDDRASIIERNLRSFQKSADKIRAKH